MTTSLKRAKVTVVKRPRYTNNETNPLRIEEKTVRVARAKVATVKEILKNNK